MTNVPFPKVETAEIKAIARKHPAWQHVRSPSLHDILIWAIREADIEYKDESQEDED